MYIIPSFPTVLSVLSQLWHTSLPNPSISLISACWALFPLMQFIYSWQTIHFTLSPTPKSQRPSLSPQWLIVNMGIVLFSVILLTTILIRKFLYIYWPFDSGLTCDIFVFIEYSRYDLADPSLRFECLFFSSLWILCHLHMIKPGLHWWIMNAFCTCYLHLPLLTGSRYMRMKPSSIIEAPGYLPAYHRVNESR